MVGKAKILNRDQMERMLERALNRTSRSGLRDYVMILCSFAGLRSQEVAWLHLEDLLDIDGQLGHEIHVSQRSAKFGKPRPVPMGSRLREAFEIYVEEQQIETGPLFLNQWGELMSPNGYQQQFSRIARECGFIGVTSHSGRRTLITELARRVGQGGLSLRDVQILAGHASLQSTQEYIDESGITAEMMEVALAGGDISRCAPRLKNADVTLVRTLLPDQKTGAKPPEAEPRENPARCLTPRTSRPSMPGRLPWMDNPHARKKMFARMRKVKRAAIVADADFENDVGDPEDSD